MPLEYVLVGEEYPDIFCCPRKFKAYDERERRAEFADFTEYRGPRGPPTKLGSPGDVYLNTKAVNLYVKDKSLKWILWDGTRKNRLAHPLYANRFLWVYQRTIQFYPDTIIKSNKITDRTVVLASIVSLFSKGRASLKRKADEASLGSNSLNTKKGIKGRLSTIEKPSDGNPVPPQSISAPVGSSGESLQTPGASSSRVSNSVSPPVSTEENVELLRLVEQLQRENALLKEQHKADSAPALPADIGQSQLRSPPLTPSISAALTDFSGQYMDHQRIAPSSAPEPQSFSDVNPNDDFGARETEERKPEIKAEPEALPPPPPPPTSSSNSHKPETIDLTVDSDDDEAPPVRKPRLPLPPRRKGPSSPSYAALAVRTDLNDIVASSGQVTSTPLKSKLPPTICRPPASAVVKDEDDSSDVECITREQFDQEAVEKGKARASSDVPPMIGSAQEVKSEPVAQTISGEDSPMDDIQPLGTSASTLEESVANTAAAVYEDNTDAKMDDDLDLELDLDDLGYPDDEPLPTPAIAPSGDVNFKMEEAEAEAQQLVDEGGKMEVDTEEINSEEFSENYGFTVDTVRFFFDLEEEDGTKGCSICPLGEHETLPSSAIYSMLLHLTTIHSDPFSLDFLKKFQGMVDRGELKALS